MVTPAFASPCRDTGAAPVILTATMGAADQRHFDDLRTKHFPPERNVLRSHITLFHQLPPSSLDELDGLLRLLTAGPPPTAMIREVYSLGKGVAFRIESPELLDIRAEIADRFHGLLTAQDQGTPRLHITVQNKVSAGESKALLAELSADFRPRPLDIFGLAAWHYRGGLWEAAFARKFRGSRR